MQIIFLDFESYYDKEYSLRKMTPVEYILDPRWELHGCAVKVGLDGKGFWVPGPEFSAWLKGIDPEVTCVVTFNALFDACILAWRYGFVPKLSTCTMSVARACRGYMLNRLNLEYVAEKLGLGTKGKAIHNVMGMHLAEIQAQEALYKSYVEYALNDNELSAEIFKLLVVGKPGEEPEFPAGELAVMDMVLRCATKPRFILDQDNLAMHLHSVQQAKAEMLTKVMLTVGCGKSDLMSNEKFSAMLSSLGVEPPMKISPTTGLTTWAFSKTDVDFIELEEHEDPRVQMLVAARLGHKSTLEESRTERLIKISRVTWPGNQQALLPVPLNFSAAHTHRLGGGWKINCQNMPRPKKGDPTSGMLRKSLKCEPGYKVIAPDSAQIEARMVAWFCGQQDLVNQFAAGADVYSNFATDIFGFTVNKNDHPTQRFVGKQGILGLGYGLGWFKFMNRLKTDSKNQTGEMIVLDESESRRVVDTYRRKFRMIPHMWNVQLTEAINVLAFGGSLQIGPVVFRKGYVLLPNGLRLFYYNLRKEDNEWKFEYGGKTKYLWGGTLLENNIQSLARIVVMDAGIRLQRRFAQNGVWLNLQSHDELVYIVPEGIAEECRTAAVEEMNRRPSWALDLPLASECSIGLSYGEAK